MATKQLVVKGEGAGCDGINEHLIEAEEGQTELLLDGNESKARCSRRFWLIAAILTTIACATVVAVGGVAFFVLRPPPPPPLHLFPSDDNQHGPRKMVAAIKEPLQEQEIMPALPVNETPAIVAEESQTKPTPGSAATDQTEDSNNNVLAVVPAERPVLPPSSGAGSEIRESSQSTSDDALWSDDDFYDEEDLFDNYDEYSNEDYDEDEEEDYDDDDDFYGRDVIDPDYYRYYGNDESDDAAQETVDVGDEGPLPKLDGYDYIVDDESVALKQAESAEYAEPKGEQVIDVLEDEESPRDNSWRQSYWADDYGGDVELSEVSDFALDSAADYDTGKKSGDKKAEDEDAIDDGDAVEQDKTQPEAEWDSRQSEQTDDVYGYQDNGYAEY